MYADTNFFGVVNTFDDQNRLQRCIDKLVLWTGQNELDLIPSKTKKVSFFRKKRNFNSHYYINATTIENVNEHSDLGVIFDSKLTFDTHFNDSVIAKSSRICALSYKFAKELHAPQLNIKIIQTYLLQIIEYLPILWYPTKRNKIYILEKCLRFATRTALRAPYRNDHANYLTYDQRLLALDLISIEDRFRSSIIILIKKILDDETKSTFGPILALNLIQRATNRNSNTFIIDRRRIPPSLVLKMMQITNQYVGVTNIINDSKETIKTKLKTAFTNTRRVNAGFDI